MYLHRAFVAQRLMRSPLIVKPEVVFQSLPQFGRVAVTPQVHVFVLHRPPQPFHEDVVKAPSLAIHAHPDSRPLDRPDPGVARELDALVRMKMAGLPIDNASSSISLVSLIY